MNAPQSAMFTRTTTLALLAAAGAVFAPSAWAGEHQLEFKLVTMAIEVKSFDAVNVEGQNVALMKARGVAYLKDGRVASKDFIHSADINKGSGPFFGYSTYTFEDGSTLTARYAGTLRAGQPMHGDYTVVSGTGMFAGAKGTGTFDSVAHKLTGVNLFNGRFTLTTP